MQDTEGDGLSGVAGGETPPGDDSLAEEAPEESLLGEGGLHDREEQDRDDAAEASPDETRGGHVPRQGLEQRG